MESLSNQVKLQFHYQTGLFFIFHFLFGLGALFGIKEIIYGIT